MAIKQIELNEIYTCKTTNGDISIQVNIGNASDETASYSIFLGTHFLVANSNLIIGNKASIGSQKATISVTIPDVLEETNFASITVLIQENGNITNLGPYSIELEQQFDTAIFVLKLSFV